MNFHATAILSGGRQKSIVNKTEDQMIASYVIPYILNGIIREKWGKEEKSYQVLELRIYKTASPWDKKSGNTLDEFLKNSRNIYPTLEKKARETIQSETYRVFIVMPIQGHEHGTHDEQRIFEEYDKRFIELETALSDFNCVAIRIDKEYPIDQLVARIKDEIKKAQFVISDLTDERPSCYFESGYAEALNIPVIYIASERSVIEPKKDTKIHFDIHMNINQFRNHKELVSRVKKVIEKNKEQLFKKRGEPKDSTLKRA